MSNTERFSREYRLMIYFAHSTMVIYSKSIDCHPQMTVREFLDNNKGVTKRVFDEAVSIMDYEMSGYQMGRAALAYMQSKYYPKSVAETETYQLK